MKTVILIVEDQPDIRNLIRMTLDYGRFEIHEAENGTGALMMMKAVRPDVVVLDVMMPGDLDGFQACKKIKETRSEPLTKVVMLSARTQQIDVDIGRQVGADAYLTKPFSPLELIDTVEKLVDER